MQCELGLIITEIHHSIKYFCIYCELEFLGLVKPKKLR